MGYKTEFQGSFKINKKLDKKTYQELIANAEKRHGFLCQLVPTQDGKYIVWDSGKKFYEYQRWLARIIKQFLEPKGYKLSGTVRFQTEEFNDCVELIVKNNKVSITFWA